MSHQVARYDLFIKLFFSPCSGLVVSGYSKTEIDKTLNFFLAKVSKSYEKFKKMYTIDNDPYKEFIGNIFLNIKTFINGLSFLLRLQFQNEAEICENLLLCNHI